MSQTEVLQQKLEHWCAASIRALSNDPSIHYRGHYLHRNGRILPVKVAHLLLDPEAKDYRKLRGVADGIALRLCLSDEELHKSLLPEAGLQVWIFELLEQLRVESLSPDSMPGMKQNLRLRFLHWADQAHTSGLTDSHAGMMVFALSVVLWSRLTGMRLPEIIEDEIESTRVSFGRVIGQQMLELRRHRHDQKEFAQHALELARIIHEEIQSLAATGVSEDGEENEGDDIESLLKKTTVNLRSLYADGDDASLALGATGSEDILVANQAIDYQIFTTEFDKVVDIKKLIRPELMKKMRDTLDKRIRQQNVNIPRLSRQINHLFSTPQLSGWEFGKEEGYLDSGRLSRLLTSPDDRQLFKQELGKPIVDCAVTLLIDNSGSMNQHSSDIAILVDTLSRALEMAGVKTEILGFTTGEWNGGKAYKKWRAKGKPENPGRLNQTCHMIYKTADTQWRRSRQAIAGLLKADLFRESIDGEALQWADTRLQQRQESRRIIMVISDGSPMDTATHLVNGEHYLDRHLKQVASTIEARSDTRLCALGVGLDLSAYYTKSLMILDKELDTKAYFEIVELLASAL